MCYPLTHWSTNLSEVMFFQAETKFCKCPAKRSSTSVDLELLVGICPLMSSPVYFDTMLAEPCGEVIFLTENSGSCSPTIVAGSSRTKSSHLKIPNSELDFLKKRWLEGLANFFRGAYFVGLFG